MRLLRFLILFWLISLSELCCLLGMNLLVGVFCVASLWVLFCYCVFLGVLVLLFGLAGFRSCLGSDLSGFRFVWVQACLGFGFTWVSGLPGFSICLGFDLTVSDLHGYYLLTCVWMFLWAGIIQVFCAFEVRFSCTCGWAFVRFVPGVLWCL